jgi:hypothetical protein
MCGLGWEILHESGSSVILSNKASLYAYVIIKYGSIFTVLCHISSYSFPSDSWLFFTYLVICSAVICVSSWPEHGFYSVYSVQFLHTWDTSAFAYYQELHHVIVVDQLREMFLRLYLWSLGLLVHQMLVPHESHFQVSFITSLLYHISPGACMQNLAHQQYCNMITHLSQGIVLQFLYCLGCCGSLLPTIHAQYLA